MRACLDLHDWSVVNNRLYLLYKLRDYFPSFKISLFTVPVDKKEDWGAYLARKDYLAEIKENLDWIQIIPHGWKHDGSEIKNCNYESFYSMLLDIKDVFDREGLPFVKGFCAPHWRWNSHVTRVLDDEGWWGSVDPRQPNMPCPKKFYRYSHPIDMPLHGDVLKLHGHVYGTSNDLGRCMDNLLTLPKDTEWRFVTDFIEEKR